MWLWKISLSLITHGSFVYILYTKIEQDIYKIYTKNIQNICKMYPTFQQTFLYILYTKSTELRQLNFVYKMYRKVCQNVGYIFYTNILYIFCIHQFWFTKSLHHKNYVYNSYIKFMQNVYTNNCMHNGSNIFTYFNPIVVHFLAS